MIDTHCHLTYDGLFERVDEVIAAARAAGVDRMISVGTTPEDAVKAAALAGRVDGVFATAGIHPHYSDRFTEREPVERALRAFAANPRIVAIGEMGLDWHYPDPPREDQQRVFAWQLEIVNGLDGDAARKPIVIHNREATDDTLAMIRDSGLPGERFVFHCFTGMREELDKILAIGAMISFTGIATFKSAADIADCAAAVPGDRIMIETDSPYLTPAPHRKVRPNEPRYVPFVAKFLAAKRGEDEAAFIAQVDANAERFFGLT